MARGGARPGAGRKPKPFDPNAVKPITKAEDRARVAKMGPLPKETLIWAMHAAVDEYEKYVKLPKDDQELAMRRTLRKDIIAAAEAAAPFLHARLSAVRVGGDAENPIPAVAQFDFSTLTDEQLAALGPVLDLIIAGSSGDPVGLYGPGKQGLDEPSARTSIERRGDLRALPDSCGKPGTS